jgi:hypothetical protein
VDDLVKIIDFEAAWKDGDYAFRLPRWFQYPAEGALGKMGRYATAVILGRLGDEGNELRRQLMCSVIYKAEGKDGGIFRIKSAMAFEKDALRNSRLELALKWFEAMPG